MATNMQTMLSTVKTLDAASLCKPTLNKKGICLTPKEGMFVNCPISGSLTIDIYFSFVKPLVLLQHGSDTRFIKKEVPQYSKGKVNHFKMHNVDAKQSLVISSCKTSV